MAFGSRGSVFASFLISALLIRTLLVYNCTFPSSREDMNQHLLDHIKSNHSQDTINMALAQLRQIYNESGGQPFTDNQEANNNDEPGMRKPHVNSQGKVKTFPCRNCDFKAETKVDYWSHIRVHIKPGKLMTCYKCPFVTEYKHHLEYHLLNHTGSKPYKCPQCTYTCVNKSMLNSHMKSHSSVYQYRCEDCDYVTKYCHTLKQHLRKYRHRPAAVLNSDGSLSPMVIDVYGTRRGPKQRLKNSSGDGSNVVADNSGASTSAPAEESSEGVAAPASADNGGGNDNSNAANAQQPALKSPQTTPSPSTSASPSAPSSFTFGILASMFNGNRNDNLVQSEGQTPVQNNIYPFQYQHHLFPALSLSAQQMMPNGGFAFGEMTRSTSPRSSSDEEDRREEAKAATEQADAATPAADNSKVDNVPLDLTAGSCQQAPLNLVNSPKASRRRKGVAIKLEHRVVEKEDTDEESPMGEKRVCHAASPKPSSAPASSASPEASKAVCASSAAASVRTREEPARNVSPGGQDRYLCVFCDIPYPDKIMYVAHMHYHGRVEPFTCNMCGEICGNRGSFFLHIYEKRCVSPG